MTGDSATSLEELRCNSCGAPLQVPTSANFVTCNHCRTQLAVRRDATASYTEALEHVSRKTEALTEQVKYLTYQNELAALDRQWESERQRHMVKDKHGHRHVPSETGAVIGGVLMGVVGIVMTAMSASSGFGGAGLIGLCVMIGAVAVTIHGFGKAQAYRAAYRRYHMRRAALSPENVRIDPFTPADRIEDAANLDSPQDFLADLENRDA